MKRVIVKSKDERKIYTAGVKRMENYGTKPGWAAGIKIPGGAETSAKKAVTLARYITIPGGATKKTANMIEYKTSCCVYFNK